MANASPTQMQVVQALPKLTWRGLQAPAYDLAPVEWSFDQAQRRYPYVDGAGHDNTGRTPFVFKARLFFVNGLRGSTAEVFPSMWEQGWRDALLDGSPGDLVHPVMGPVRAVPIRAGFELKAAVTSGIIVDVGWEETVEDPTRPTEIQDSGVDVPSLAAAVDAGLAAFNITYPDGSFDTSISDAVKSVQGQIFSLSHEVTGAINRIVGGLDHLFDTVNLLTDHSRWSLRSQIAQLAMILDGWKTKIAKLTSRATATLTLTVDLTLDAFARQVGNTLEDIMGINLSALRTPIVRKGTTLRYYTS